MLLFQWLLLVFVQAQTHTVLNLGTTIQEYIGESMNQTGLFYTFSVSSIKFNSDVVVMVHALNMNANPNIYISIVNQFPTNFNEGEIASCEVGNYCIIDKSSLEANTIYYIGVICNNCRFNIRVDFQEEYVLKQNDYVQLKITSQQSCQLAQIQADSNEDDQLEIEVSVINFNELETEFNVYLKIGDQRPTSDKQNQIIRNKLYDFKAQDSWNGAKVLNIQLNQLEQVGIISLLIVAQEGALLEIRTQTFGQQRELKGYEKINDFVEKNTAHLYYLDLTSYPELENPNITPFLKMNQFSGYATLYVNPSFRPVLFDQYQFKTEGKRSQILMLNHLINSTQELGNKFYIAVFGNQQCTYQLELQFQNVQQLNLDLNIVYDGTILENQLTHFKFIITGSEKQNITVTFNQPSTDFDIAIKKCQQSDCQISDDDRSNVQQLSSEKLINLFIYREEQMNSIMQFEYDPIECYQFMYQKCEFAIVIYPHSKQEKSKHYQTYQILVFTTSFPVQLKENTPHKSLIYQDEYRYFKFLINDDSKFEIMITPIQGRVTIYASKNEKWPSSNSYDWMSRNNIISIETNTLAKGIHYLSIYGETAGYFMVTIITLRDLQGLETAGLYPWEYIQLYEGNSQDYILNYSQVALYKIDLTASVQSTNEVLSDSLQVDLVYDKGKLLMLGFDHPSINNELAIWKNSNTIKITGKYPEILYLKVLIEDNSTYVPYRITYRLGEKPITLVLGEVYTGYIEQFQLQRFIYIFFQKEDIRLQKHVLTENQSEIIVTAWRIDKQLAQLNFETEANIMASDISFEKCQISQRDFYYCEMFIEVSSFNSVNYQLLITRNDTIQQLYTNSPIFQRIPETFHFYYIPYLQIQPDNIIIDVINQESPQQLQILVSLSNENFNEVQKFEFPKNQSSVNIFKVSKIQQGYSHSQLSIYAHELNDIICSFSCILAITVKKVDGIKYHESCRYMIQYSSHFVKLHKYRAYYDMAYPNSIKYYKINVQENKNLMIILTPISQCEVDIVVSKDKYPNVDDYQWTSRDYFGDQLVIENDNPLITEMAGDYFVGVYGAGDCSYSLIYQTGDFHFYQIQAGFPINVFLFKGEVAYFKYRNLDSRGFTIILNSNNKQAVFFIENLDSKENDYSPFLQNVENFTQNRGGLGYKVPVKLYESFCQNCLIAVKAQADTDIYIQVQVDESVFYLTQNLLIMNQISFNEFQKYFYKSLKDTELYIEVLIGSITIVYGSQEEQQKKDLTVSEDELLKIKMSSPLNHNGFFTIDIFSEDLSIFKIRCADYVGPNQVSFYQVYNFDLNAFQSQQFIYKSFNQEETYFSIMMSWNFNFNDQELVSKHKKFTPSVRVIHNQLDQKQTLLPITEIITDKSIYFQYTDTVGDYQIEISNGGNYLMNAEVIFGNKQINVLIPKKKMTSVLSKSETAYWEYFCKTKGQLLIQIQQCTGELNVFGLEYLDALKNGQYTQSFQRKNDELYAIINIQHSGMYYIAVNIISIKNSKAIAPYTITAQLIHHKSYIPVNDIKPSDGGQLNCSVSVKEDQFQLTVTGKQFNSSVINDPEYEILQVKFYLIVEYLNSEEQMAETFCESKEEKPFKIIANQEGLSDQLIITKILNLERMEQTNLIRINVYFQANVKLENGEVIDLQGYYQPVVFNNIYKQEITRMNLLKLAKKILVFIGIFFLVLSFIYFKKKRLQRILRFEAQSDPNPNIELYHQKFSN